MPSSSPASRTLVIAEAGVNHNGDLEQAKRLIEVAAEAGADYVKFQSFKASELVTTSAKKAAYQETTTGSGGQLEMLQALELDREAHEVLWHHCRRSGIEFLSTPFDLLSLDLLVELGLTLIKIPSGEVTNRILLEAAAATGLPLIVSTGMSTLGEVEAALQVLGSAGDRLTLLHCNTEYPTPFEDANIKAMVTMGQAFGLPVGLSDHTVGTEVCMAAVALGAKVIEKHFTLDRNAPGPDHRASLEPAELKALVSGVRRVEAALGDGRKRPTESELKNREPVRRSLHFRNALPQGHRLQVGDLCAKRPGTGVSPMDLPRVIGQKLRVDVSRDELLHWSHLQWS